MFSMFSLFSIPCTEGFHNASRSTPTSHMAIVGHQCRAAGLSEAASKLLKASWRSKTKSSYESLFKKWDSWCQERGRNPISGPVADIANFLAELFQQGYKYRSLNSYRSAISSVHEEIDNVKVGKHPFISRVLKGVSMSAHLHQSIVMCGFWICFSHKGLQRILPCRSLLLRQLCYFSLPDHVEVLIWQHWI